MSTPAPSSPLPMPTPQGWFAPLWYGGLNAEDRAQALALDRRLFSRQGWWVWFACALAWALIVAYLYRSDEGGLETHWRLALFGAPLLLVAGVWVSVRAIWLRPGRVPWQGLMLLLVCTTAGAILAYLAVGERFPGRAARYSTTMLFVGSIANLAFWGVAKARLAHIELARRLEAERDAAARLAAEARLHLLQAQIQPHFIFNTLAAVQHWVDTGDARGPGLLHELTGFLRGSTELLAREHTTLADELALARHYLAIMRLRLGDERLAVDIDVAPETLAQPLPPGLLLTVLENAVEHGVAPMLRPGRIAVRAARAAEGDGRFVLTVQDNGAGLAPGWHEGVGLSNSRARLAQHFGDRAQLTLADAAPGTRVQLSTPWLVAAPGPAAVVARPGLAAPSI